MFCQRLAYLAKDWEHLYFCIYPKDDKELKRDFIPMPIPVSHEFPVKYITTFPLKFSCYRDGCDSPMNDFLCICHVVAVLYINANTMLFKLP